MGQALNFKRLDRLIAVHVFGFEFLPQCKAWYRDGSGQDWFYNHSDRECKYGGKCSPHEGDVRKPGASRGEYQDLPSYSKDTREAWKVVHEMRRRGFGFTISDTMMFLDGSGVPGVVMFQNKDGAQGTSRIRAPDSREVTLPADEAGICIAAMRALGVEWE